MKIITIINRRGGVGKTATAHAIGSGLHENGKNVLFVDLDSQNNLTFDTGANPQAQNIFEVLTGANISGAIQKTCCGDIIPAAAALAGADVAITETGKEYKLREALEEISGNYDFCIIDTPPALGILTINALTASDIAIIPAQAEIHSLQGIYQLNETIKAVKKYCNPKLKIFGVLITRYNSRTIISADMKENIKRAAEDIGTKLLPTPIRECTAIKEAQAMQTSIFKYAPKSNAAKDYTELINAIIKEV